MKIRHITVLTAVLATSAAVSADIGFVQAISLCRGAVPQGTLLGIEQRERNNVWVYEGDMYDAALTTNWGPRFNRDTGAALGVDVDSPDETELANLSAILARLGEAKQRAIVLGSRLLAEELLREEQVVARAGAQTHPGLHQQQALIIGVDFEAQVDLVLGLRELPGVEVLARELAVQRDALVVRDAALVGLASADHERSEGEEQRERTRERSVGHGCSVGWGERVGA